tara:strand:+ start:892 stop:1905 length:1014 start_codon:yes stop_codon:yes gene_type:complete
MNATMPLEKKVHYPVMLDQVLSIISPQHGGTFIDCTFGQGGYSKAILKYPKTKVFALDRDKLVEKYAISLSKKFPKRFSFVRDKFSNLNKNINPNLNPKAIILDLGLSSLQLLDTERGFSFNSKNSLSMEMGINKCSAYDVVNNIDKKILANIIKVLGEEKDGKKIANKIEICRKKKPIKTSKELAQIIKIAKKNYINFKKNPATKTFQAIRIFVNRELTELILVLIEASKLLSEGGILIVVSFHSLEDKIVKSFFNFHSNLKGNSSRYLPVKENINELFKLTSKKPLTPNEKEIENNINSRSAKLRYGVRTNKSFLYSKEFEKKFKNFLKIEETRL